MREGSMSARVEAAAGVLAHGPNKIRYGEDLDEWTERVIPHALAAADGVMFSGAAIERAAKALEDADVQGPLTAPEIARAVVAALREEA